MDNITIPPEALEAVKEAIKPLRHNQFITDAQIARAACLAMLNAWQTEKHKMIIGKALDEVGGMYPAIILPLPEKPNG